jgi:protein O-GlcNAc transferase
MTASVLTAIGLDDLIATTAEQYIDIAASWVSDPDRLARTRSRLRQQVEASRLCDGPSFTRDLESAYEAFHARHRPSRR